MMMFSRRQRLAASAATALVLAVAASPGMAATQLQVGPAGATEAAPNQLTLEQALAKIGPLSTRPQGLTIHLSAGVYRLDKPLQLDAAASGSPDAPVVFQGPANGRAVLSGARVVDGFSEVHEPEVLARLPAPARGHVLAADLKQAGVTDFGQWPRRGMSLPIHPAGLELIYRGSPATLARWPNEGFAQLGPLPDGPNGKRFTVAGGRLDAWHAEPQLQVSGFWSADWADESIPVESIDLVSRTLTLRDGGPRNGMKAGQRVVVQNALSELDSPGEWYLDQAAGRLYFWPPATLHAGDVEVTVLDTAVELHGASNVQFRGVDVESVRGDAFVASGGSDVLVADARIRNAGARGVAMQGLRHRVVDSDIYDTGQGGIALSGGDRQNLSPGGLVAEGNRLARYARWVKTYRPAIELRGVGNTARGNLIVDGPHSAILFYGNDHVIEFNDISNVARETGDVGAIYTGTDWTARGTIIRDNFIHDVHGPGQAGSRAIYLDDQTSGDTVRDNLVVRADRGLFLGGGRDNVIDNNMFVNDTPAAIHLDDRGLKSQRAQVFDPQSQFRKELLAVPYDKPPYSNRYQGLADILKDNPGKPLNNRLHANIVLDGQPLDVSDDARDGLKIDGLFTDRDVALASSTPAIAGRRPTDFRLAPSSPALAHGFRPLQLEAMDCVSARWKSTPPPSFDRCTAAPGKQP